MKKSWNKRVSGCNLVAVKTIWKFSRTLGLPYPSFWKLKAPPPPPPPPHMPPKYESGLLWHIQEQ